MEMFLLRGFEFAHEEEWDWEERFAQLRLSTSAANGKGKCRRWYIDETCVNVKAKWCYRYRAIDRNAIWRLDAEYHARYGCSPALLSQRLRESSDERNPRGV